MLRAVSWRAATPRVVVMNSDGPTLPLTCLTDAFRALEDGADVTLGPSDDGGYYLIGMKQPAPRLLREVQMSTPRVLRDTLMLADEESLRVALLPAWYDVDDLASLLRLNEELAQVPIDVAQHTRAYLSGSGQWPW